MSKKTEQCFCQSYYDDENILCDCTCGKCGKPAKKLKNDYESGVKDFAKYLQKTIRMKFAQNGIGYYRNKFLNLVKEL